MRKIIIACFIAAVVFTGYSKATSHTETRKAAVATEPSLTEVKNDTDIQFEEKLKAIDDMEKQVIDDIRTEASKAMSEIKAAIPTTTTATTAPEPKEIELNVETQRGDGTLTFIKAETKPATNQIAFYYETSDERAKMSDIHKTGLIGVSGQEYKTQNFGGTGNKGFVMFDGITDYSDLSTVTLTYAFEGYEPVTVTFDIPV